MTDRTLADGRILRFPDGTPDDVIDATVKRMTAEPAGGPSPAQEDIRNELGLDPTMERGAIAPFGRTRGGETEFAVPQIAMDLMEAIMLPGAALKGKPFSQTDILNMALSIGPGALKGAGVGLRRAFDKVPDAVKAEADLQTAIKAAETGAPGAQTVEDAATIARAARFKEQNIPATRGDVSQDFGQQATESRLQSMASGEAGEPLRQLRLEQSEAFKGRVNELVDSLGVPANTGDSVKAALEGRKQLLRAEKNALYKEVADSAPEITRAPLFTDDILAAAPDARTSRRIKTLAPGPTKAVDDLLVEFGIVKTGKEVDDFIESGGEVIPLTLGNFEDFRVALNQIERADATGAASVLTGPLKRALDEEAGFIDDAVKESGITDQGVVDLLKEARSRVRTLKTEFSPQAITGRLTGVKRDGVTPLIEASKVGQELLRPGAPIENLQRTLTSLRGSGKKGVQAIRDLRASVVMDALEAGLKAPSRKTSGIETVGGNQFAKALDKFGEDKLALLFKGNEEALRNLKGLKQTALDISPAAAAVPKGSAPVILDLMKKVGRIPGLEDVISAVTFIGRGGSDNRAVRKALNSKPKIKNTLTMIRKDFPAIAEKLGLIGLLQDTEVEVFDPKEFI